MGRVIPLLFLLNIALLAIALISCLSIEDEQIRGAPRVFWIVLIVILPLVGPLMWFRMGRPKAASGAGGDWLAGLTSRGRRDRPPASPDDDPDFLRSIDVQRARKEREEINRWEDELRRMDDDPRWTDGGGAGRDD